MTKQLTKVLYKPDHTQPHEYNVIINPDEVCQTLQSDHCGHSPSVRWA